MMRFSGRKAARLLSLGCGALGIGTPAQAATGLTESVYHGIIVGSNPSDATIDALEATLGTARPSYSFTNAKAGLTFASNTLTLTTAQLLAPDAAGAATLDLIYPTALAVVAEGSIILSKSGGYTFSLGNGAANQIDDAARLYIDGALIAEQNYLGGTGLATPYSATRLLDEGAHSIRYVWYQTNGSAKSAYSVSGAGAVSYSTSAPTGPVPEVATWAMMVAGFGALGLVLRRRTRGRHPRRAR